MCFCLFSSLLFRREAGWPLHVAREQDQSHAWECPEHAAGRVRWQAALLPGIICSICTRNPNIKDSFRWPSGCLCSPELPLKSIQQLAEVTPLISVSYHSSRTDQPDMRSSSKALEDGSQGEVSSKALEDGSQGEDWKKYRIIQLVGKSRKRNLWLIISLSGSNYKSNSHHFKWSLCAWYFTTIPHLIFIAMLWGKFFFLVKYYYLQFSEG